MTKIDEKQSLLTALNIVIKESNLGTTSLETATIDRRSRTLIDVDTPKIANQEADRVANNTNNVKGERQKKRNNNIDKTNNNTNNPSLSSSLQGQAQVTQISQAQAQATQTG